MVICFFGAIYTMEPIDEGEYFSFITTSMPRPLVVIPSETVRPLLLESLQVTQPQLKNIEDFCSDESLLVPILEKERAARQRQMRFIKWSSGVAGVAAFGAYVYRSSQKTVVQKRFIADVAAATNMTTDLFKGAVGCIAGAYAFYKIRSWVYDGYIKEQEVDRKLKKVEVVMTEQLKKQAIAINEHAQLINQMQLEWNFQKILAQIVELERVAKSHAVDIDRTQSSLESLHRQNLDQARAINVNAEIMRRLREQLRDGTNKLEKFIESYSLVEKRRAEDITQKDKDWQMEHKVLLENTQALEKKLFEVKKLQDSAIAELKSSSAPMASSLTTAAVPKPISQSLAQSNVHQAMTVSVPKKEKPDGCCSSS